MNSHLDPRAGQPASAAELIDVGHLCNAYFALRPNPARAEQRVAFGTSGHRGSALDSAFNEWHVLAITQAICDYRSAQGINGPLFLGLDTHSLSAPAGTTALEVLAANGVEVMLASHNEFTPTPALSLAILNHNRDPDARRADGIVVTPSHNPPRDGGFKYNPPHGGPAGAEVTTAIQTAANHFLEHSLQGVRRLPYAQALQAPTTHRYDYLNHYVEELDQVIDLELIRNAGIRLVVDPLGGAGVNYWAAIAERWQLELSVVSTVVDPQFGFMSLDWDGQIRMDPSSPYAMQRLLQLPQRFDIAFACDTDHDRHGIVTPSSGLLPANHYQAVAIDYLFRHRPQWGTQAAVGKSLVSTQLIDRVAERLGRRLYEVPVGFKWFCQGLLEGQLGFASEESAGASFLRRDGRVWTTDKDGITAALLAAEITARCGQDPGALYQTLTADLGEPHSARIDGPATPWQKQQLAKLSPEQIRATELAGEPIISILNQAPGNNAPLDGIKVKAANGWYAARPSGTENIYKVYAESFRSAEHLQQILSEAQAMVDTTLTPPAPS